MLRHRRPPIQSTWRHDSCVLHTQPTLCAPLGYAGCWGQGNSSQRSVSVQILGMGNAPQPDDLPPPASNRVAGRAHPGPWSALMPAWPPASFCECCCCCCWAGSGEAAGAAAGCWEPGRCSEGLSRPCSTASCSQAGSCSRLPGTAGAGASGGKAAGPQSGVRMCPPGGWPAGLAGRCACWRCRRVQAEGSLKGQGQGPGARVPAEAGWFWGLV